MQWMPGEAQAGPETVAIEHLAACDELVDRERPEVSPPGEAGLLVPIIACRRDETAVVVDGVRRLGLLHSRGSRYATCIMLPPLDPVDFARMRVELNRGRGLSLGEQVRVLRWLQDHDALDRRSELMEVMGISRRTAQLVMELLTAPHKVVRLVTDGTLHLQNVTLFLSLDDDDREAFLQMCSGLSLSVQMQRQWLEWLPELACAGKQSVSAILSDPPIREIVKSARLNPPQRIQKLHALLMHRRFPRLTAAEMQWRAVERRVNPDRKRVVFEHAPAFERDRLQLHCTLHTPEEARKLLSYLGTVGEEDWRQLLHPTPPEQPL
jgi:hypothetical protein